MLLPTMPASRRPELDVATLASRIRDHGRETQLFLSSVLVSVAVANAAYVFALLLGSGITPMVWLAIRWWVVPEHPEFLRFQGILGLIALAISILVLALIERDRQKFAALVSDSQASAAPD